MTNKETRSFTLNERCQDIIESNAESLGLSMSAYLEICIEVHDREHMDKKLKEDMKQKKELRAIFKRRHNRYYKEVGTLISEGGNDAR